MELGWVDAPRELEVGDIASRLVDRCSSTTNASPGGKVLAPLFGQTADQAVQPIIGLVDAAPIGRTAYRGGTQVSLVNGPHDARDAANSSNSSNSPRT